VGLALRWLASFLADWVARPSAEKQVQARLTESLFVFPPWLAVGVPLFVGALTMLAAYPARRGARLNPVARLDRPRRRETIARMTYPSVDESFVPAAPST
jgi:hypothetical protein